MRRIWYALAVIILGAAVVFFGYYLRPKTKLPQTYLSNTLVSSSTPETQTAAATKALTPVFKEQVLAYFESQGGVGAVDTSGRVLWTDGKSELVLSSSTLPLAFSASASYDGQFVIIGWGSNANAQYRIWSAGKNYWRILPSGAHSPSFSPNTHQLVYLEDAPNGTRLSLWNLDSSAFKGTALATFPLTDIAADWISPDKIELRGKSALLAQSSDFMYSLSRKTVSAAVADKNGLDVSWSPSGREALALLGQAQGGSLFLIDNSGEIAQTLSVLTLPEKCAWDGDQTLFCALPQDANALKTVLPDNFYKNAFFSNDNLYKIDASTGNVSAVLENQNGLDAESLAVYGGNLYFINRLDGYLYSLPIPK